MIVPPRARGARRFSREGRSPSAIVGGGLSADGRAWVASRPGFLVPVRVLSRLLRRRFLDGLAALHGQGRLAFFGDHTHLADGRAFARWLAPLRAKPWVVYAKPPFAGPESVLAYLARYTHRVAIADSRLVALDDRGVTFRYKNYRRDGHARHRTMTLAPGEFIRRFLLHVLPKGFHRIRHYGLFASATREANLARARELLAVPRSEDVAEHDDEDAVIHDHRPPCPCCGGHMVIVERFERGHEPRGPPGSVPWSVTA
jgi:hypothetical protein